MRQHVLERLPPALFAILLMAARPGASQENTFPAGDPPRGQAPAESASSFEGRFAKEVWPLLERGGDDNCLSCHAERGTTPLLLFPDAAGTFKALLSGGYLDTENPSGLLARVTSPQADARMPPPPHPAWDEKTVESVRRFLTDVSEVQRARSAEEARRFPEALLEPWAPARPIPPPPRDNAFITYTQLKGKILSIFGDDWRRGEKDLFHENIAQFGGADFKRTFNESSKPSATFLSALDRMAGSVSSRAYLERTGPFAGLEGKLPNPLERQNQSVDGSVKAAIGQLFEKILFRKPTSEELESASSYLRNVYRSARSVALEDYELTFELTVSGEEGAATTRSFTLPVESNPHALHLEWVDQSHGEEEAGGKILRKRLGKLFFRRGDGKSKEGNSKDGGQLFHLSNRDTVGAVSFHAIEVRGPLGPSSDVGAKEVPSVKITAGEKSVHVSGAWSLVEKDGVKYLHDGNTNKGDSQLTIPLDVKEDGLYEVFFAWPNPTDAGSAEKGDGNRGHKRRVDLNDSVVPVEVVSSSEQSSLGLPPEPPPSTRGEAFFLLDQTIDNIAFQNLHTSFRFGPESYVEIRNAGTRHRVVADAVKFEPAGKVASQGKSFLIDNDEAEGRDGWKAFDPGQFKPYNVVGKGTITDDNQRKGELSLKYRPASKTDVWDKDVYYRVEVGFPGKEGNETQAPVIVRAEASSPIVALRFPYRAYVGAEVVLDASKSYDIQGGKLSFHWTQRGGPRVDLGDPSSPRIAFRAPARDVEEEAWAGLSRALIKHPDFLFTSPLFRARAEAGDRLARQRLLLVKVATDLVARAPSQAKFEKLEQGRTVEEAIDGYLESKEFQDFYFHRVRLYLESDGTPEGDEPVRLWCHIAFRDRSFQEILSGDYTVNTSWAEEPRPAFHGKSGLLTMPGFLKGKPGLPHFNYAAQVAEKFLGYVFEVPPEVVAMRDGITAVSTTSPGTVCYSCHKVLTPLAFQRTSWDDQGQYRDKDGDGKVIDDTDRGLVPSYPYRGKGMAGFAARAKDTERFIRTMINLHFIWFFGRDMRYESDERALYKRLWDEVHSDGFKIKGLIKAILASPQYQGFLAEGFAAGDVQDGLKKGLKVARTKSF